MSRVGARREREGVVPRATGVPRLAKPARHARYAREVDPFRVTAPYVLAVPRRRMSNFRELMRRCGGGCDRYAARRSRGRVTVPGVAIARRVASARYAAGSTPASFADSS